MRRLLWFWFLLLMASQVAAAGVDDLGWMTGEWSSRSGERTSEEIWTTPASGLMLGLHRDIRGERAFFEFLRVEERDGETYYVAQPGGKPPTSFRMVTVEEGRVTFENPEHDFPQRIIYERSGDELCARIEGTMNGEVSSSEWCWKRRVVGDR